MKVYRQLLLLTAFTSALFVAIATQAHEGHDDPDLIIKNLGNLGKVDFSVSCSTDAQKAISTGVGLLHHMMYAQGEMFFGNWLEKEPTCAMLHWGYAMTLFHPLWPDTIKEEALIRGEAALTKAMQLTATSREKAYLNAASAYYKDWQNVADKQRIKAWASAQKTVYQQNPEDIDAAAFYALSLLVTASKQDQTFSQNREAGLLLDKLQKQSPTHPGAIHYTIHAYDNAPLAELAIDSARAYDQIAPDVPHALHMPSHIFVRLGMWGDVASWNIRSAKAALKYPTKGATTMHYVHAIDYLIYAYLQLGYGEKAAQALKQVQAYHPIQGTFPAAYALSTMPARIALEQKNWQQASQLSTQQPDYINWPNFPQVEAITYYARGIGAVKTGDLKGARENINMLDELYQKTKILSPNYWAILVDAQRQVVKAWVNYAMGEKKQALVELRQAADLEDTLDKNPVTPSAVLPARELLADMLMLNQQYADAVTEYEASLAINPNRRNSITGLKAAKGNLQ